MVVENSSERTKAVARLVAKGRRQRYLTHSDVAAAAAELQDAAPANLDPLYERIQEAGIEIVTDDDSAQAEADEAAPPSSEELARAFEDLIAAAIEDPGSTLPPRNRESPPIDRGGRG